MSNDNGHAPKTMPTPENWHKNQAGCHWLERVDYDGRPTGLEVYQWQPAAKLWCRPNEYACGRDLDLIGYRYVGPCKRPLFPQEKDELKALVKKLDEAFRSQGDTHVDEITLTRKDYDTLRNEVSDLY